MHTSIIRHAGERYTGTGHHHEFCAVVSAGTLFNKRIPDTYIKTGYHTHQEYYRSSYAENRKYNIISYTRQKVAWISKPGPAQYIPGPGTPVAPMGKTMKGASHDLP